VSLSFTVTFRDLQKLVQSQQSGPEQSQQFKRIRDKPFWIWDLKQHKQEDIKTKGDCCFNHIIRLPRKDGIEKSIFDYEKLLYDSLLFPEFFNHSRHKDRDDGRAMTWTEKKDWLIKSQVIHFDSIFQIHEKHYYIVFVLPVLFLQSLLQHFL
jgi:hypothetical protein